MHSAPAEHFFWNFLFFAFFSAPGAPLELKTPEMKRAQFPMLCRVRSRRGKQNEIKKPNTKNKKVLFWFIQSPILIKNYPTTPIHHLLLELRFKNRNEQAIVVTPNQGATTYYPCSSHCNWYFFVELHPWCNTHRHSITVMYCVEWRRIIRIIWIILVTTIESSSTKHHSEQSIIFVSAQYFDILWTE